MEEDLVRALEALIEQAPGADAFHLRLVDEFSEGRSSPQRTEEIFAGMRRDYEAAIAELSRAWGEPAYQGSVDRDDFPAWSEALLLSYWRRDGAVAYLALRHDDDHEPMFLEVGALTDDEVTTLLYTKS